MNVIGVGTPAVDYFFKTDKNFLKKIGLNPEDDVAFKKKNLTPGKILREITPFKKSPGGMSLNTVAILGKLGINVAHYSNFGTGADEKFLESSLPNVNISKVLKTGKTHICFCLLTNEGKERTFIYEENEKEQDLFKKADYKFLNSSELIHFTPVYLKDPEESLKESIKLIKKINKPEISFTPGIFFINFGLKKIKPIIKKVEILFLNKREIKILTGLSEEHGSQELLKIGPKVVVCTLGEKGVLITTERELFLVRAKKVKNIVDSTGSGDAFAAGFLYGYLKKKSLKESAEIGNKIARLSLNDYGLSWVNKIKPNFLNFL